jgi:hypothetical protein
VAIHYSCESFYDRPDGRSPRVTSIAVRNLSNAQTHSFSIHQIAEKAGINPEEIENHYDELEKEMLDEFYKFVERSQNYRWLHWNMRDANYGFPALEHRFQVLGGEPVGINDDRKYDLARILVAKYGKNYVGHPRFERIIEKNKITKNSFLTGAEEADAFDQKDFVSLHQSTLRKVDVICNIAERAHDNSLKTNATWWRTHGGSVRGAIEYLKDHPMYFLLGAVAMIAGLVTVFV